MFAWGLKKWVNVLEISVPILKLHSNLVLVLNSLSVSRNWKRHILSLFKCNVNTRKNSSSLKLTGFWDYATWIENRFVDGWLGVSTVNTLPYGPPNKNVFSACFIWDPWIQVMEMWRLYHYSLLEQTVRSRVDMLAFMLEQALAFQLLNSGCS